MTKAKEETKDDLKIYREGMLDGALIVTLTIVAVLVTQWMMRT